MADPGGDNDNSADHVTICHALGSPDDAGNGYNVIAPSAVGVASGHANWDEKAGELPPEGEDSGHLADVIPPFDYEDPKTGDTYSFPGQNWEDNWEVDAQGQALEDVTKDMCVPDEEVPPTEPPTEEPPTEEPPTEEPPTEEPPTEEPPAESGQPETPEVVQTDGTVAEDNSMLAALGVAMLFAGGATAVAIGAGVSGRRH